LLTHEAVSKHQEAPRLITRMNDIDCFSGIAELVVLNKIRPAGVLDVLKLVSWDNRATTIAFDHVASLTRRVATTVAVACSARHTAVT